MPADAADPGAEIIRVVVQRGRKVYLEGRSHPFREGEAIALPRAQVAHLIDLGHVAEESATPAA